MSGIICQAQPAKADDCLGAAAAAAAAPSASNAVHPSRDVPRRNIGPTLSSPSSPAVAADPSALVLSVAAQVEFESNV